MGLSSISFWEVLVIVLVLVLVFGSKRLGSIGSDLGAAIRDFRKAIADDAPAAPGPGPAASAGEIPPPEDDPAQTRS